jgi:hypothetical protein
MPQNINSNTVSQPADFVEPEFATQKRPSVKTEQTNIVPVATEAILALENKLEK